MKKYKDIYQEGYNQALSDMLKIFDIDVDPDNTSLSYAECRLKMIMIESFNNGMKGHLVYP